MMLVRGKTSATMAVTLVVTLIVSVEGGDWPFGWKAQPGTPNTLAQIARSIDDIEDKILDDGLVVIKQPDVWGQSRMTLYRKDFEAMMRAKGPDDFKEVLAARVARLDEASLESQTSLGFALGSPAAKSGGGGLGSRRGGATPSPAGGASAAMSPTIVSILHPASPASAHSGTSSGSGGDGPSPSGGDSTKSSGADSPFKTPLPSFDEPYALLSGKGAFQKLETRLGLDPPIFLDEKKRYFDHLNEIRRVNIGDDNADSAGYGLYLIRMPVSIQPGEITLKGHGALLTVTAHHEFDSNFLRNSFHNLVINDLVDQLGPIVYELIRNRVNEKVESDRVELDREREKYFNQQMEYARAAEDLKRKTERISALDKEIKRIADDVPVAAGQLKVTIAAKITQGVMSQFSSIESPFKSIFNDIVSFSGRVGSMNSPDAIGRTIKSVNDLIDKGLFEARRFNRLLGKFSGSAEPAIAAKVGKVIEDLKKIESKLEANKLPAIDATTAAVDGPLTADIVRDPNGAPEATAATAPPPPVNAALPSCRSQILAFHPRILDIWRLL